MKTFFEVHLKLVMTVWIILVAVLGLLYLMNYMKFNNLMSGVVSSRLEVMSRSLERSVIKGEQLGLSLKTMNNLPELMQRELHRDTNVKAIHMINRNGEVLFSTVADEIGQTLPEDVTRRALKSTEPTWMLDQDRALFSGIQLFDNLDQLVGSTVIEYNKSSYAGVLAQVRLHLLEMTIVIFGIFAILIFAIVRLGFGDINKVITLIHGYLSSNRVSASQRRELDEGTMAHEFARQMLMSQKLKKQVEKEIDQLSTTVSAGAGKHEK